ncbi:hypothetical protein QF032_007312 [Streptomyces achromogenes]|nr:hypothetical protein [Streptomyces achromogenes]
MRRPGAAVRRGKRRADARTRGAQNRACADAGVPHPTLGDIRPTVTSPPSDPTTRRAHAPTMGVRPCPNPPLAAVC